MDSLTQLPPYSPSNFSLFGSIRMGDQLALFEDHLLTESNLQSTRTTIESREHAGDVPVLNSVSFTVPELTQRGRGGGKLVECRICQEEDEATNMEIPCSCCGSLKYVHRKCVQRWCNVKGDTTCEICLQQFKPGYTAPPKLFYYGSIPMSFRGRWEITSTDLHDSQIITMVPSGPDFSEPSDYDLYSTSASRSTVYFRSVAVVFMTLMVLRHSLYFLVGEAEYSVPLFFMEVLRNAALLIPIAIMVRVLAKCLRRRQQQQDTRDIPVFRT